MAEDDIWDSWEDFADSTDLDKHVDQHLRMTNGSTGDDRCEMDLKGGRYQEGTSSTGSSDSGRNTMSQFRILPRPVVHEDDVHRYSGMTSAVSEYLSTNSFVFARTAYTPQVKILRRPGQESGAASSQHKERQILPARTLAEREAAYAKARDRILGPDPPQSAGNVSSNTKSRSDNNRKNRNTKQENSRGNSVHTGRLPKGPDKSGKGFNSPR